MSEDPNTHFAKISGIARHFQRWVFFVLLVFPVSLISFYSVFRLHQNLTELIMARHQAVAHLATLTLQERLSHLVDLAVSLADRVQFRQLIAEGKWSEAIRLVETIPSKWKWIDRVLLTDISGQFQADAPALAGVQGFDYSSHDWHQGVSHGWRPYVSNVYKRSAVPQLNVISVAVPIKSEEGKILGVLCLQIRLDVFLEWGRTILGEQPGLIYYTDAKGRIAAHPEYPPQGEIMNFSHAPYLQQALQNYKGIVIADDPIYKKDILAAYEMAFPYGWAVVFQEDVKSAFAPRDQNITVSLVIYGAVLLLTLGLAFWITRLLDSLQESGRKFKVVVDNAYDAFITINSKGKITEWNRQAEVIFGWSRKEVIGRVLAETIIPLQYREAHKKGLEKFMATGEGPVLNKIIEITALRRDGREFPVELTIQPFKLEEGYVFNAFVRDITERKQAERKFQSLLETAPDAMVIVNRTGEMMLVNAQCEAIFGYKKEELLGKKVEVLVPQRYRKQHPGHREGFFQEPRVRPMGMGLDLWGLRKNGSEFPIEISLSPIETEEGMLATAAIRDITERNQAEEKRLHLLREVENANRELRDFAYVVSHDLKAPLRGIASLAEWISTDYKDKLNAEGKEQLAMLVGRVKRMHRLIDGILHYSRVGRAEEEKEEIDLKKLVSEVTESLAIPKNIEIRIESALPPLRCQRIQVEQVFQNLLNNAIRYLDKPKGLIRIGCEESVAFWKFYIADNGPGIEEKYFEKIFQMFQTLAPRDEFESTGLGLAIVKKIVELWGGKIWVESKPGQGSTFFFTLPKV